MENIFTIEQSAFFILHSDIFFVQCQNGLHRGTVEDIDPDIVHTMMADIANISYTNLIVLAKYYAIAKYMLNNPHVAENLDMRWLNEAMQSDRIAFIESLL
jgi:hypothetical protein